MVVVITAHSQVDAGQGRDSSWSRLLLGVLMLEAFCRGIRTLTFEVSEAWACFFFLFGESVAAAAATAAAVETGGSDGQPLLVRLCQRVMVKGPLKGAVQALRIVQRLFRSQGHYSRRDTPTDRPMTMLSSNQS